MLQRPFGQRCYLQNPLKISPAHFHRGNVADSHGDFQNTLLALSHLRAGDTFIVWRLDRLGRSLKHLIETVTLLKEQGVAFKSLTENIDTSTATGNLVFQIFGALAEFERNLITERTMAGLAAARARGRKGGRPRRNPSSGKVT